MTGSKEEYLVRRKLLARAWEPRQLKAPIGQRILVLSPHPDDESIGAGGLLLAHRGLASIHLVCLCNGERGVEHFETAAAEARAKLVETRKAEFRKTAEALQAASVRHLDFPDGDLPFFPSAVELLQSAVAEIRPDTVLLPWFLDDQADHRWTNLLYAWACADLDAMVLGYEVWSLLEPNAIFDITQFLSAKLALIENYQSQLRTVDYASYASGLARVRAYHAALSSRRSGAAEAFLVLPNAEYCEMVSDLYGVRGRIRNSGASLLGLTPAEVLSLSKSL